MKYKRTTSAEKAVVMVFLAALPIGGVIGYNVKQVPEPEVIEKYEVRTVNVGDYDFNDDKKVQGPAPECRSAWDDFKLVQANLREHNVAVSQVTGIIQDLYPIVSGNAEDPMKALNGIAGDVEQYKYKNWSRMYADTQRMDSLEAKLRQCADIKDTEE